VEAFFGFSTAGVSVGSGARAANSEATGEILSMSLRWMAVLFLQANPLWVAHFVAPGVAQNKNPN
jgi:hypothetical protein